MIRLMREVRLSLGDGANKRSVPDKGANTWAGWPPATTICPYLVVRGIFQGHADLRTGYLADIRRVDEALRQAVLGGESLVGQPLDRAARLIWAGLRGGWPGPSELVGLELQATPYLQYAIASQEPEMVTITQCFEFAASHRLARAEFSDQRNWEIFGKCSNPNGHGHNYRLEVTVWTHPEAKGESFSLPGMESVVQARVLDRFDHKHLNTDCPEFANLNPSVESIAEVIWGLLVGRFEGAELAKVSVWETAKTRADYFE